jgi:thiol-disulfide isomerase/thioredoxin
MKRFISLVALGLFVLAGCSGPVRADDDTSKLIGKPAPEISLKTVDDKSVKLSDEKGKVVLIDFWATWCGPCMESLPHVQKLAADAGLAKKGLVVWAVNSQEGKDDVKKLLDEKAFTFTAPLDSDGKAEQDYDSSALPTTIVIGRDGVVKFVQVGIGPGSDKAIEDAINAALNQGK